MNQMVALIKYLDELDIPFEVLEDNFGYPQLWYPNHKAPVCDAVCHPWSYGGKDGFLEIMGLTYNDDEVEGWLTAENVAERIADHYKHFRA